MAGSARIAPAHLVAAHARHHHVEQHEVGPLRGDLLERLLAGGRGHHLVALDGEQIGEQLDVRGVSSTTRILAGCASCRALPARVEQLRDGVEEVLQVDRLGRVAVEARGQ